MSTFEEAIEDAEGFIVSPGCKTEAKGYYTCDRVDPNSVPRGWNVYNFREDGYGNICDIEPYVMVNFGGSFITQDTVKMNSQGYHSLRGRGGYTYDDEWILEEDVN